MKRAWLMFPFLILFLPQFSAANPITFEGLSDGASVGSLIAGFTFSNGTVIVAGISLNEFEFPPHSGFNVLFDDGGPLTISFNSSVLNFSGYFTYLTPLLLEGFDSSNNLVVSSISLFSSNLALSGDPGSSANELLSLSYAGGLSSVRITGDPFGGSFVMDDVSGTNPTSVPESNTLALLITGLVSAFTYGRTRKSYPQPQG